MPSVQNPQTLPSFNLALRPDHYTTVLPNLSFPSRPNAHIPWSGSSVPLLFSNNTPPETTVANSTNVQGPTIANMCFNTCSVSDALYGMSVLIWYNLSMILRKVKLVVQKLFGVRTTRSSATANV